MVHGNEQTHLVCKKEASAHAVHDDEIDSALRQATCFTHHTTFDVDNNDKHQWVALIWINSMLSLSLFASKWNYFLFMRK